MRRRSLVVLAAFFMLTAGCLGLADGNDDLDELDHEGDGPAAVIDVQETDDAMTYRFDATRSIGDALSYHWDLGDGAENTGDAVIEYTYSDEDRIFPVTLTVTQDDGAMDRAVTVVEIGDPSTEPPEIGLDPAVHWIGMHNELPVDLVGDTEDVMVASALLGDELPDWYPLEDEHDEQAHNHSEGEEHDHSFDGPTGDWEDSTLLSQGDAHEITFEQEGIYVYQSEPHPSMTGIIIVANTGNAWDEHAAVTTHDTRFFAPQVLEVQPGTTVTWTNAADTSHDVSLQQYLPVDSFHMPLGPAVAVDFDGPGVHTVAAISQDETGNPAIDHGPILVTEQEPQRGADIVGSGTFDTPDEDPDEYTLQLDHDGEVQITWTWETTLEESLHEDPLEGVRFDGFAGDPGDGETLFSTSDTDFGTQLSLDPGTYTFVVTNEDAFLAEYSFHVHAHVDATPPWIEDDGHDDHEH